MLDRYVQDLLLDYLEGELDADRRAQLDTMLEEDPQLASLLSEMARDREALRSLPQAEAPGDLVHDVTQTLERRMLLDDSVDDTTPIPISRAMAGEPTRSISWGRVMGLTGLAASVALVAGILVISLDDTLQETANEFADNTIADAEDAVAESVVLDESADDATDLEGLAELDSDALPQPTLPAPAAETARDDNLDRSAARASEIPGLPDAVPAAPGLTAGGELRGERALDALGFGSTAAISVYQPRQQLVLFSESPEVSREQLFDFCLDNGIPVVQPDQVSLRRNREARDITADDAEPADDADTDAAVAKYALLINEDQLDTLVINLNNSIALKSNDAGQASPFSNQAAVVKELPEGAYGFLPAERLADDPREEARADQLERNDTARQQTIKLRSPDFGSEYDNTRNAYNIQTQQQAGYAQQQVPLPEDQAAGELFAADPKDDAAPKPEAEADLALADKAALEAAAERAIRERAEADPASDKEGVEQAPVAQSREAKQLAGRIDPSRGNWLSAHLPVADTTPLLLSWREDQVDRPTRLVPVMIQRAEPTKVNTLRKRQQVEYANRGKGATTGAKATSEGLSEQAEAEPTETDEADKPAEAVPAEPTE